MSRRALLMTLGLLLLAAGDAHAASRSLDSCVRQWNGAAYGNGRLTANALAPEHQRAALSVTSEGYCVLAFPASAASGPAGVLISGLDGDYVLQQNPFGSPVASVVTRLQRVAASRPNVRVALGSGRLRALARGAAPAAGGVVAPEDCARTITPIDADAHMLSYDIPPTSVPCPTVRTLLWAWSAATGTVTTPLPASASHTFLGWTCTGTIPQPPPAAYSAAVTCTDGADSFDATVVKPRTAPVPVAPGG